MTTDIQNLAVTVTTVSGAVREIPAHLVDAVVGLDSEGRIVVDNFAALDNPAKGNFLFGLTLCCNASDKGGEDDVYCRACHGIKPDADTGAYLFAWETDGAWGYPELDPISDKPQPVRFEVRKDGTHPYFGIWDLIEQTWHVADGYDNAIYAAGVPMWRSRFTARDVAASLNTRTDQES